MKTNRMAALVGLLLLATGSIPAMQYNHTTYGGSYSTTVTIPAAAVCAQYGGAYGGTSYSTNYGPLGYYTCNAGQSFQVQGDIAAGDWYIDQLVSGSGYSGCTITW